MPPPTRQELEFVFKFKADAEEALRAVRELSDETQLAQKTIQDAFEGLQIDEQITDGIEEISTQLETLKQELTELEASGLITESTLDKVNLAAAEVSDTFRSLSSALATGLATPEDIEKFVRVQQELTGIETIIVGLTGRVKSAGPLVDLLARQATNLVSVLETLRQQPQVGAQLIAGGADTQVINAALRQALSRTEQGLVSPDEARKFRGILKSIEDALSGLEETTRGAFGIPSEALKKFGEEASNTRVLVERLGKSLDDLSEDGGDLGKSFDGAALAIAGLKLILAVGLLQALANAARQFVGFQSSTGLVAKQLGLASEDTLDFRNQLRILAVRLGEPTERLLQLAAAGRQLRRDGVGGLLEFAEAARNLGRFTTLDQTQAAGLLTDIGTQANVTAEEISRLDDVVADLSDQFSQAGDRILLYTRGVASALKGTGLFTEEMAAVATIIARANLRIQDVEPALQRAFSGLQLSTTDLREFKTELSGLGDVSQRRAISRVQEAQQALVQVTGKTIEELRRLENEDPAELFVLLVSSLEQFEQQGGNILPVLQRLGIEYDDWQRVLRPLATQQDELRKALQVAGIAATEQTAGLEKARKASRDFGEAASRLREALKDLGVTFGQTFEPVRRVFLGVLDLMAGAVTRIAEAIRNLSPATRTFLTLVSSLTALRIALTSVGALLAVFTGGRGFGAIARTFGFLVRQIPGLQTLGRVIGSLGARVFALGAASAGVTRLATALRTLALSNWMTAIIAGIGTLLLLLNQYKSEQEEILGREITLGEAIARAWEASLDRLASLFSSFWSRIQTDARLAVRGLAEVFDFVPGVGPSAIPQVPTQDLFELARRGAAQIRGATEPGLLVGPRVGGAETEVIVRQSQLISEVFRELESRGVDTRELAQELGKILGIQEKIAASAEDELSSRDRTKRLLAELRALFAQGVKDTAAARLVYTESLLQIRRQVEEERRLIGFTQARLEQERRLAQLRERARAAGIGEAQLRRDFEPLRLDIERNQQRQGQFQVFQQLRDLEDQKAALAFPIEDQERFAAVLSQARILVEQYAFAIQDAIPEALRLANANRELQSSIFVQELEQQIEALEEEAFILTFNKDAHEDVAIALEIERRARGKNIPELDAYIERILTLRREIEEARKAHASFADGIRTAAKDYVDAVTDASRQGERVFSDSIRSLEDLLADFFVEGELGWEQFVQNIQRTLARAAISRLLGELIEQTGVTDPSTRTGGIIGAVLGRREQREQAPDVAGTIEEQLKQEFEPFDREVLLELSEVFGEELEPLEELTKGLQSSLDQTRSELVGAVRTNTERIVAAINGSGGNLAAGIGQNTAAAVTGHAGTENAVETANLTLMSQGAVQAISDARLLIAQRETTEAVLSLHGQGAASGGGVPARSFLQGIGGDFPVDAGPGGQPIFQSLSESVANQAFSALADFAIGKLGGAVGGIFAEEGAVSHLAARVALPARLFEDAPRFQMGGRLNDTLVRQAVGLGPEEIPAILHPREAVIPLDVASRIPLTFRNGRPAVVLPGGRTLPVSMSDPEVQEATRLLTQDRILGVFQQAAALPVSPLTFAAAPRMEGGGIAGLFSGIGGLLGLGSFFSRGGVAREGPPRFQLGGFIPSLFNMFSNVLGSRAFGILSNLPSIFGSMAQGMGFGGLAGWILPRIGGTVGPALRGMLNFPNQLASPGFLLSGLGQFASGQASLGSFLGFQQGGLVPGKAPLPAILHPNEAVIPLDVASRIPLIIRDGEVQVPLPTGQMIPTSLGLPEMSMARRMAAPVGVTGLFRDATKFDLPTAVFAGAPRGYFAFLGPLFSAIGSGISAGAGAIGSAAGAVGSGILSGAGAVGGALGSFGSAALGVGSTIAGGLGAAGSAVLSGLAAVPGLVSSGLGFVGSGLSALGGLGLSAIGGLGSLAGQAGSLLLSGLSSAGQFLGAIPGQAVGGLRAIGSPLLRGLQQVPTLARSAGSSILRTGRLVGGTLRGGGNTLFNLIRQGVARSTGALRSLARVPSRLITRGIEAFRSIRIPGFGEVQVSPEVAELVGSSGLGPFESPGLLDRGLETLRSGVGSIRGGIGQAGEAIRGGFQRAASFLGFGGPRATPGLPPGSLLGEGGGPGLLTGAGPIPEGALLPLDLGQALTQPLARTVFSLPGTTVQTIGPAATLIEQAATSLAGRVVPGTLLPFADSPILGITGQTILSSARQIPGGLARALQNQIIQQLLVLNASNLLGALLRPDAPGSIRQGGPAPPEGTRVFATGRIIGLTEQDTILPEEALTPEQRQKLIAEGQIDRVEVRPEIQRIFAERAQRARELGVSLRLPVPPELRSTAELQKSLAELDETIKNLNLRRTPFSPFAVGGVVTEPTLGLLAERGIPEAVVPLPDGRAIPVVVQSPSMGGGDPTVVNVTYNIQTPNPDAFRASMPQILAQTAASLQRATRRNG